MTEKKEKVIVFGIRAIIEAVDSNKSINKVFIQRGLKNKNGFELIKILNSKSI